MEEEEAAAAPERRLTTAEVPVEEYDGGSVSLPTGDLPLVPVTAMVRNNSILHPAPLRHMPQTSYALSGGDLIRGLKELEKKTREIDGLSAALFKMEIENDRLKALESRCTGCARLREELKLAQDRVWEIEEEFHVQRTVFNSGKGKDAVSIQTKTHEQKHLTICDIWASEVTEAFEKIKGALNTSGPKLFAGIDTEFCIKDGVTNPDHAPRSAEGHYEQACRNVNGGDLVQVGIFLASQDFEAACDEVFQFNIKFDSSSRHPDNRSLAFLRDVAKLDLAKHATDGIPLVVFMTELVDSGLLRNHNITWITFQCYSDFGYIIRGITQEDDLPTRRWRFTNLVRAYFPSSFDVKVFHELGLRCRKPSGKQGSHRLSALVSDLEVVRLGEEHGSASDAHATVGCFHKMVLSDPAAFSELRQFKDLIYGVMPSVALNPRPTSYSDAAEVDVWANNFEHQAKVFSASFSTDTVLTVEVRLLESPMVRSHSYASARKESASSGNADCSIAVSSWSGNLAFGRLWVFHLRGAGEEHSNRIYPVRLTQTLKSCGAVLNTRTRWTSSSGAPFLYLMPALTVAGCLPQELLVFHNLCVSFFPNFCILQQVDSSEPNPRRRAFNALQNFLRVGFHSPVHYIHDLTE